YSQLHDFAVGAGLEIGATYSNNLVLDVRGTAGAIERAFFTNLNYYLRPDGTTFYAPDQEPSANLAAPLLRIDGLENYELPRPMTNGSGFGDSFTPTDLEAAYTPCTT